MNIKEIVDLANMIEAGGDGFAEANGKELAKLILDLFEEEFGNVRYPLYNGE